VDENEEKKHLEVNKKINCKIEKEILTLCVPNFFGSRK
jgi:hypothetical protein